MAVPAALPQVRRFATLEAARAVAATLVVVHHATLMVAQPRYLARYAFGAAPVFFNAGVDFFFVLSGFIIAFVHWGDLGRDGGGGSNALRRYGEARLTRIYPLYWAILLPLAVVYAVHPGFGEARQHDPGDLLASFLLVPMPEQPVLGVAWSLTYEMGFYLLFAGVIVGGRKWLGLGAAWAVAIVAYGLWGGEPRFPLSFLLNPHDLQFLMGVAAAAWLRTRRAPAPAVLLGGGVALFAGTFAIAEPVGLVDPLAVAVTLGAGAMLCIVGLAELERSGALAAPRWLAWLGGASYAVYLIHVVAESAAIRLFLKAGVRQPEALVVALAVSGVAAGIACHLAVERPLLRLIRARLRSRAAPSAAAA